jgi:uncharacterized membrane protein YdjX (TVP38/TMEM64 family)
MRWLRDRRIWIAAGVVGLVLGLRLAGFGDLLSLETLARYREALTGFVAANAVLAASAYVAVYIAAAALSLPGATVLTLAGGFLFGPVAGTGLTVAAATIGATVLFLLARRIFGADALERLGRARPGWPRGCGAMPRATCWCCASCRSSPSSW